MALYDVSTSEKKTSPELVAGGTLYASNPVGTILPFGGTNIPSGWGLCDGSAVSRTTYSELFAVIGTSFGAGDGSTTFNLPDMRESVPKGAGLTGKSSNHMDADGLAVGEFLDDRIQSDNKTKSTSLSSSWVISSGGNAGFNMVNSSLRIGATTEVKSVGVNYIICMKQTAVPADFLAKVDEAINEDAKSPISASNKLVTESELNDVFRVYEYTSNNAPTKASFLTLLASSNAHMDFKFINVVTNYMPNSSSYWYVQKFGGIDALHIRLLATDWVSGDLYTGDANSSNNTITWWRLAGTQV